MEEKKIAIVTDSSCDLSDEQLKRHNINMISLRVVCQNKEYRDRVDITESELYELLEHELPKTSLPLPEDITTLYDRLVSEGYTDIIHLSISSGLSGTYNLVRMLTEDYTDRVNVHLVDTLTLSTGLGLLVLIVAEALEAGSSIEEAIEMAKEARKKQMAVFVIRTLEFLRKGGRIGKVEGVIGSILNIKPVIYVNDEGVYETIGKARGYKNSIEVMMSEVKRFFAEGNARITVVNGNAREDAAKVLERLKKEIKTLPDAFISQVSPVLAVHTGPGLIGIIGCRDM